MEVPNIKLTVAGLTFEVPATDERFRRFKAQYRRVHRETRYFSELQKYYQEKGQPFTEDDSDEINLFFATTIDDLLGSGALAKLIEVITDPQAWFEIFTPILNDYLVEYQKLNP